jgi:hypothetical protein
MFAVCAAAIVATGVAGAELTSVHVVAPPMFAALLVLLAAALSVDYFGLQRRHTGWNGTIVPTQATRAMLGALERRFRHERRVGALRTGATARALLIALAEHRELRRAGDVVDFLATEAATRAHRDVVGDALRALALAELGRGNEAKLCLDRIPARAGAVPAVAFARGRIAADTGDLAKALQHVERGLRGESRAGAALDLALLRARLLARTGRADDARTELARIAAAPSGRAAVEALVADEAAVAHVAREALGIATVYR